MIMVLIDMSVVFRFGCDPKVYSIHLFIGPRGDAMRPARRRAGEKKSLFALFKAAAGEIQSNRDCQYIHKLY